MATTLMQAFLNAGFEPVKPRKERPKKVNKCRKCGTPMNILEGTNVMVCPGDIEVKDAKGDVIDTRPCNHRFIFSVRP